MSTASTAASQTTLEAPSEVALFRHQAGVIHDVVRTNMEGLTHEDSLVGPRPAGNRLNWVMGHLVWAYNGSLGLLGQEPVMDEAALERYARGAPPLKEPADAVELGELMNAWDEATERVDAGLANLTAEELDRPAPSSPSGNPDETVRSLLSTIFFHQAYHAGQTALLRRIAGKDGAIP